MNKAITHYLKQAFLLALTAILEQSCTRKADSPLLEGILNVTEPTKIAFVYDYLGDNYVEELITDSTGSFIYNPKLEGDEADLYIYVGQDIYGAYVKEGCSTHIVIDGENVTFKGDNADRCTFLNTLYHTFSPWAFKPTPDHPFDSAEWNTRLEKSRETVEKALDGVIDSEVRARYQQLADATYKYYLLQNLALERMMNQTDNKLQSDSIIATIDPNADITRLSGLLNYWYNAADLGVNTGERIDLEDFFARQIKKVDSVLTNEGNKKSLINTLCNMFLMYQPSDSAIHEFRAAIAPQLAKVPRIEENIEKVLAERAKRIKDGDLLPGNPTLIARDGNRTTLADVIRGKVAYIDFWATWCAPCCHEIPYFEKVWEQYKENERIVFVSISQDDDRKAWEKKIDKDQPTWPNYIFDKNSGSKFLEDMSINSIPRFVIVGADGRILSADAVRPSDKDIATVLDAALAR